MTRRIVFLLAAGLCVTGAPITAQTSQPTPPPAQCSCMGPMGGGMMGAGQHGGMMGPHGGPGGPHMADLTQASETQLRAALQMHQDCAARLQAELQRRQAAPR